MNDNDLLKSKEFRKAVYNLTIDIMIEHIMNKNKEED